MQNIPLCKGANDLHVVLVPAVKLYLVKNILSYIHTFQVSVAIYVSSNNKFDLFNILPANNKDYVSYPGKQKLNM